MQTEQATMTVKEFMNKHLIGVQFDLSDRKIPENFSISSTAWDAFVSGPGGEIEPTSFEFYTGSAIKYPNPEDLIECLISDAQGFFNSKAFEDWANSYGYDQDSRKAERIYEACKEQAQKFLKCLGMSQAEFMKATENIEF